MAKPLLRSLQIDILKRHIGPFLFCFMLVMFLLLMQFLILHIDKLVGKGLPFGIIIELILTNLAYMVVLAVPMSVLVANLMAFGKFSELNELTAIKAAGINPLSIIRPVLIATTGLTLFLIWFSNDVLPEANYKARSLFIDIRMQRPGFDLRQNVFYDGIDHYNFLVRQLPAGTDSLVDVTLFQEERTNREQAVIKARKGYLTSVEDTDVLSLYMFDGNIQRPLRDNADGKKRVELTNFGQYRINFDLSDLSFSRTDPNNRRRDDRTMSSQAMLAVIDSLNRNTKNDVLSYNRQKGVNQAFQMLGQQSNPTSGTAPREGTALPPVDAATEAPAQQTEPVQRQAVAPGEITVEQIPIIFPAFSVGDTTLPRQTRFVVLSNLQNTKEQQHAVRRASTSMRNSISQLINLQNNMNWRTERIAQYMVEVHKKVSIPVACIIFVLVGAPLGILTRKGNLGFNALISTVIFTYYWIGIIQGEKLADRMFISPFTGMWFTNITLFVLGIYLMLKVMYEFRISDLWRKKHEKD